MSKHRVLFLCNANSARSLVGQLLFWFIRALRLIDKPNLYAQALLETRRRLPLWLPLHTSD